jgi:transposase
MKDQKVKEKLDFQGEPIYVGIDVHKKQWRVFVMGAYKEHKGFSQGPSASVLAQYLRENFPGAIYYSVYEAGFCGFSAHEALEKEGIHNIVVNPADVPTMEKERKNKSDKVDCRKLCKSLRNGELTGIFVPDRSALLDRELVRLRVKLIKDIRRGKSRIKSVLNLYGVEFEIKSWSKADFEWLKALQFDSINATVALKTLIDELEYIIELKNKVGRQLRIGIVKNDRYARSIQVLCSVVGVGLVTAITTLTEVGDTSRFSSLDRLSNFIGLVPTLHSSGDREHTGGLTSRKNNYLLPLLIEAAWSAAGKDPALMSCYNRLRRRMEPQNAIIRIARKLLARMRYVLIHQTEYKLRVAA